MLLSYKPLHLEAQQRLQKEGCVVDIKEVANGLNDNSSRFPKDGFPQLCEQGDNICQIKWYNDVCSRKTYTIKHWLKGAHIIWA